MKSGIAKRSIMLNKHKTSISLEDQFWDGLRAIADEKKIKLATLLLQIDNERNSANLSSAIRVFVFNEMRAQAARAGAAIANCPAAQAAEAPAPQGN
jgi:predicted DNA-binding ribbon-helix-helix protein